MAKEFKQKENVDCFDAYTPMIRISSIQVLLASSLMFNLYINQMDVKTTFLISDLEEEVYIKQLEVFVFLDNEKKVCKIIKSLYRLKQTPK